MKIIFYLFIYRWLLVVIIIIQNLSELTWAHSNFFLNLNFTEDFKRLVHHPFVGESSDKFSIEKLFSHLCTKTEEEMKQSAVEWETFLLLFALSKAACAKSVDTDVIVYGAKRGLARAKRGLVAINVSRVGYRAKPH